RRIERVRASIASPLVLPSPYGRRVGIRIGSFGACSDFTRVTARRIAQQPRAAFVARLQPSQLPDQAARQLPDQSTIIWLRSSLTDGSRPGGARPLTAVDSVVNPTTPCILTTCSVANANWRAMKAHWERKRAEARTCASLALQGWTLARIAAHVGR